MEHSQINIIIIINFHNYGQNHHYPPFHLKSSLYFKKGFM